jgi:hypothetical protein
MKRLSNLSLYLLLLTIAFLSSCKKDPDLSRPGNPTDPGQHDPNPNPNPVPNPVTTYKVKVKAVMQIGDITYDSLPALLEITSWDSSQTAHFSQVDLQAGANEVALPKAHVRYQLRLSQWGLSETTEFTKENMPEGSLISLGSSRTAKKLKMEERFIFAAGNYQPDGKTIYHYNANGTLKKIDFYQKRPQHSNLLLYFSDLYEYDGNKVVKIKSVDHTGYQIGYILFTYDANGKVVNMEKKSYDQLTYAAVSYGYEPQTPTVTIDYLYDNGHAMEYTMKFRGGNKVEDNARSSTGGGEGGTYGYDFNINPFAHMNMPDIYLSKLSKNNLLSQQKGYSGGFPSAEPSQYEYNYDAEGYPTQLIKNFKSYMTGEHLYKTKTIFTY